MVLLRPRRARWALVATGLVVLTSCGGGGGGGSAAGKVRTAPASAATAPTVGTTAPGATTTAPPVAIPPASVTTAPAEHSPVDDLVGVGNAQQVISVIADGDGQATATLTAYERSATGWRQVFGPWRANLGANGFAPPGQKREGDDRTPSGAYGFDFAFGVLADPGVKLAFRAVTGTAIVWDDDPTSEHYNEWVDTSTQDAGSDPEPMYNQPAYNYGAVITYNADRTPGLGSAIFLHVSKNGPTAGCVAVPQDQLVELLRWLDPARQPRIVMGTRDAVTR